MIATGVEVLEALAPADSHILDLGGGTGALSSAVLAGLPAARVTVLDVDAEMIAEARRRLARFGDRVSFQEASFLDPLPPADAVIAPLRFTTSTISRPRRRCTGRYTMRYRRAACY